MLTGIKKIFWAFSPRERVAFVVAALVALISGAILTRLVLQTITITLPRHGGSYTEGLVGQPSFVNPVTASTEVDRALVRLVFSSVEDVAAKIEAAPDGRIWRVRLKDDIRWHDGEKMTSDDIVFTVKKIQDPDSRSSLAQSWQGVIVTRVSEREIQFNLGTPYAFFEDHVKKLYILPQHLFEKIPVPNWRISEFNLKPVGSGPYRLVAHKARPDGFITQYHFKVNHDYFRERPFITNIYIRLFEDKETLLQAFNAGLVDGVGGLEASDVALLNRPYELLRFTLPSYYAIFINQTQNLALKDANVRSALEVSIDKKAILQKVLADLGEVVSGPVPAASPYFDPDLLGSDFDLDRAKQLLDEADWSMNDSGVRTKSTRNADLLLEATLVVPDVSFLKATANELKTAWEALGVKITLNEKPLSEIGETIIKNREYQMILFGNTLNTGYDLYPFWHSSERFHPGGNLSIYSDKEVDRLIESIRQTLEFETRQGQYKKLQAIIARDNPAIFLYSPNYLYVAGKQVKGVNPRFIYQPYDRFSNIGEWHVKTKRVLK